MGIIETFLIGQNSITVSNCFMQISQVSGSLTELERKKIDWSLWKLLIRSTFYHYTNERTHMILFLNKSYSYLLKSSGFPLPMLETALAGRKVCLCSICSPFFSLWTVTLSGSRIFMNPCSVFGMPQITSFPFRCPCLIACCVLAKKYVFKSKD